MISASGPSRCTSSACVRCCYLRSFRRASAVGQTCRLRYIHGPHASPAHTASLSRGRCCSLFLVFLPPFLSVFDACRFVSRARQACYINALPDQRSRTVALSPFCLRWVWLSSFLPLCQRGRSDVPFELHPWTRCLPCDNCVSRSRALLQSISCVSFPLPQRARRLPFR